MTWLHRSCERCIENVAQQQIAEDRGAYVTNSERRASNRSIDSPSVGDRSALFSGLSGIENSSSLFTNCCSRSHWNESVRWRLIADLARKSWKRREREEMEVIRTSALKLVCPRGGSTCPLKISKRYRDRVSRARLTAEEERARSTAHTRAPVRFCTRTCFAVLPHVRLIYSSTNLAISFDFSRKMSIDSESTRDRNPFVFI